MKNSTYFEEIYGLSSANALNTSSTYLMTNSLSLGSGSTPNEGEFTFDSNTNIIHCLKNTTGKRGYFAILLENICVGDIVMAQMECCAISGVKPAIVMDILKGSKSGNDIITAEYVHSQADYNRWTTINLNKVHECNDRDGVRVVFGIGGGDTGEYLLRNLKVKVLRQNKNTQLNPEIQTFNFVKVNGNWTVSIGYGNNSGANISFIDNFTMKITYNKSFLSNKMPIAIATIDEAYNGFKYRVFPKSTTNNSVLLFIQDIKDYIQNNNPTKDWGTVEDNSYFNLTVIG